MPLGFGVVENVVTHAFIIRRTTPTLGYGAAFEYLFDFAVSDHFAFGTFNFPVANPKIEMTILLSRARNWFGLNCFYT
jgi:hypothetical protein